MPPKLKHGHERDATQLAGLKWIGTNKGSAKAQRYRSRLV